MTAITRLFIIMVHFPFLPGTKRVAGSFLAAQVHAQEPHS